MKSEEIIKLETEWKFFESFEAWRKLHSENPLNLEIYLRLLFSNWYNLTLVVSKYENEENVLREALPSIANFGITHFSNEAEFLLVFSHICSRFFFYLFELPEKYGEEMSDTFVLNFPTHPIAQFYSLNGTLTEDLKKKIIDKMAEIKDYVENKYSGEGVFNKYFLDTFTNTKPFESKI